MTKEGLAAKLNSRKYRHEITREEEAEAKASGLVVVFGASDDLMELRGAIDDEADCYEGGNVSINKDGLLQNKCDEIECPYFQAIKDKARKIRAVWNSGDGYSWTYQIDIPHAEFDIMEDGQKYCRGIVFELSQV